MNIDDVLILVMSYKRPTNVRTAKQLTALNYEPWRIVVDDEDPTVDEYRKLHGDRLVVFDFSAARVGIDMGDNFSTRGQVVVLNEAANIARRLGYRYYVLFDDDYVAFDYTYDQFLRRHVTRAGKIAWNDIAITAKTFTRAIHAHFKYFRQATRFTSLAFAQRGDFFAGKRGSFPMLMRKAMNSFFCDTERPLIFRGRHNEDVSTYTSTQRAGALFGTCTMMCLRQVATQSQAGGFTEMYLDDGTYIKTFFSVLYAPSCVRVSVIQNATAKRNTLRIHHRVKWKYTAPKILRESVKKTAPQSRITGF